MEDNQNKNRRPKEVAFIFKRVNPIKGKPTTFKPVKVVIGKYDDEKKTFTDKEGNVFHHMSVVDSGEYGYGLRAEYRQIHETYNKKTPSESLKAYEKDFRFMKFYFGADSEDFNNVYLIAEDIITHSKAFLQERDVEISPTIRTKKIDTKKIIDTVRKKVIGQNEAIDDIVTTLWQNHHSKIKRNMLLIGPTGVGKTEIIKTISKELKVPMVVASASGLTKSGYKGESVEDILKRLLKKASFNVALAEKGIIVLDEFDKLASQGISGDTISTSGVQEELLKFTEGCEYDLDISDNPYVEEKVSINTEGITFIAMGAFADLNRQSNTKQVNSIGFGARVEEKKDEKAFYNEITSDDLIKYGIIAELVGRLPVIIPLNPITEEILIQIMNNPNNDMLGEKVNLLKNAGIRLRINNPDAVKRKIAKMAIEKNIGVRGLNSVVEKTFVKAMKEVSQSNGEYDELIIDENTIDDPKKYILKRKSK